jgi:galactofuranosylgalactofuranosylrhamnosyl-N-acetylglucosaminyl-diphospho-decaprenol beta-1,5/1,6-galactofuranosyltransferase
MNILQHMTLPNIAFGAPEEMYARLAGETRICRKNNKIFFDKYGRASFDTFFNSITVKSWKQNCKINDLFLSLKGRGKFVVRFCTHQLGCAQRIVEEHEVELNEHEAVSIEFVKWQDLKEGMLYYELLALGEGNVSEGWIHTCTAAPNNIKIGIVITHFNRKEQVVPAIQRIRKDLLEQPLYKSKFSLIVVDNSKNLDENETQGATLIPNKNLGGAGGFMRGLLHIRDHSDITHCLLMDDDASCEIESLRRTFAILSYSDSPRLAVAGSLLRELEPYRLFEKGARFDGLCRPLKTGMDMRRVKNLLFAELNDANAHYGGWWFFAFAAKDVNELAFPFFVRGDDIGFGLANKFDILTLNGISCWGDDFGLKSGPMPLYLDLRNHLIHSMRHHNKGALKTLAIAKEFIMSQLYSYNYASACALNMALDHVMKGPDFFIQNMDMVEIRKTISSISNSEKMIPICRADHNLIYKTSRISKWRNVKRKLTLNGFLLPQSMIRNRTIFQHKSFHACLNTAYRNRKILHVYEPHEIGYIAQHDKKLFFRALNTFVINAIKWLLNFNQIRKKYNTAWGSMTDESFWRNVYKQQ